MCFTGDDADLCSELLQESLDALRALPEATLFDEGTVSSVWLEVVERATKFLRFVIYRSAAYSADLVFVGRYIVPEVIVMKHILVILSQFYATDIMMIQ